MINNYFKVTWRTIMKNKLFSFVNIFGLSIGLTCCILISLYIYNEASYDRHFQNADDIFLLGTNFIDAGEEHRGQNTSAPLGAMLQREYPEIVSSTRLLRLFLDDKTLFQVRGRDGSMQSFYEDKGLAADSNFFQVFSYRFLEGNANAALLAPNSIVLDKKIAEKLFGSEPALNKLIHISSNTHGDTTFRVTGVVASPVAPSHIDARFFLSFRGGHADGFANDPAASLLNNNMFYTYLKLKHGTNRKALEEKFPSFIHEHLEDQLKQTGKSRKYFLTSLSSIHLSGLQTGLAPGGSKTTLFLLGSIAVLTLLIACINFMNLSTANSAKRGTEVGIRKVLGAQRRSLLQQFLGESMIMSFIALLVAGLLSFALLSLFEKVSDKVLVISTEQILLLGSGLVILALITGLIAGSYPALYLSSFKPIKVLKGKFSNTLAAISLRRGLVVFQFVVSIALIVASLVISKQMNFMKMKDLGFTRDQQVIVPVRSNAAKNNLPALASEARQVSGISSVGAAASYPGIFHPQDWLMYAQGQSMHNSKPVVINTIDNNFLQTLQVHLLAGRLFSPDFPGDTLRSFVINEETVKQFGFGSSEAAVGQWMALDDEGRQHQFSIVGVVKNFHFKDLHESIQPFAFRLNNHSDYNYLVARTSGANYKTSITGLEQAWRKLNPNEPFEYSFLDSDFQKNYEAEEKQASLINYFTIVAILISCLGLFGLATFTAEQRRKEIGIRKVLGASVSGLIGLLSKDFLKLVIIAVFIASPLAWYVMRLWLRNFSFQISIGWEVFALSTVLVIFISFATISIQALKAAVANPVKSLRTE